LNTQKREIQATLESQGWKIAESAIQPEWWADEMWEIESTWTPVGVKAFITFLVDPQAQIYRRRKGEHVWAAMASREKPPFYLPQDSFELSLGSGWLERLPTLLEYLSALRSEE
jgi:hypothetical protein